MTATADTFLMPALPQNSPSSIKGDKSGALSQQSSVATEGSGWPQGQPSSNFLSDLEAAFQDQIAVQKLPPTFLQAVNLSDKAVMRPEDGLKGEVDTALEEALMDIMALIPDGEIFVKDPLLVAVDIHQLVGLLDKLGLKVSAAEGMLPSGAGLTTEAASGAPGVTRVPLPALKQLIEQIQPWGLKPDADTSTALEGLRKFFADALQSVSATVRDSELRNGLSQVDSTAGTGISATAESADEYRGIAQGQAKTITSAAGLTNQTSGSEKSTAGLATLTGSAPQTANASGAPVAGESAGKAANSSLAIASDNPEKADAPKPPRDEGLGAAADRTDKGSKASQNGTDNPRTAALSRSPVDSRPSLDVQSRQENSSTGESSPVSKLINDAQAEKASPAKVDPVSGDNGAGRVVKTEGATSDSSTLNSQIHSPEKTPEATASAKKAEAGQPEIRTQTMEQIVRRAVIQIKDGHHEARIELKPEFLGHVRMQVITENQQVTLKILTEFGFVKDMIENNIQQLKADLQHQGLEVDKLDVSVSRDANGNKHDQENMQQARSRRQENQNGDRDEEHEEQQKRTDRSGPGEDGSTTVDYFA